MAEPQDEAALKFVQGVVDNVLATPWGAARFALASGQTLPVTRDGEVIGHVTSLNDDGSVTMYVNPYAIPPLAIGGISISDDKEAIVADENPEDQQSNNEGRPDNRNRAERRKAERVAKADERRGGSIKKPEGSAWMTE